MMEAPIFFSFFKQWLILARTILFVSQIIIFVLSISSGVEHLLSCWHVCLFIMYLVVGFHNFNTARYKKNWRFVHITRAFL